MISSQALRGPSYRDRGWPEDHDLLLRLPTQGATVALCARYACVTIAPLLSCACEAGRKARFSPVINGLGVSMHTFSTYGQLAREDRPVRLRARRVVAMRTEQGPTLFPDRRDLEALRSRMHGILVGAIQAMEEAARTVGDCTDEVPWARTMDLARQVWDKSRHVDIFSKLLEHVEGSAGARPPAEGVAGLDHGLAGPACDVLAQLVELAQEIGDPVLERALDYVLADAITHAHGSAPRSPVY